MECNAVVLGTANAGKIAELSEPLGALGVRVLGLKDFPDIGDIAETGGTFEENALIKARAVAHATGLVAIADDSGLMVDALNGAPGVYSARFGDDWESLEGEGRDARNIRKLLHILRGVPCKLRGCHFVAVMAAASPKGVEMAFRGEWHGSLLDAPLGENGFGYDPVFWDAALGKTAAQLKREEKTAVSHRGKAVAALLRDWPLYMSRLKKAG